MRLKHIFTFIGYIQLVYSTAISGSRWYKDVVFNDVMPASGHRSSYVTYTRSKHECGIMCGQKWTCMSFFYASVTAECQMYDVIFNTTIGLNGMLSSQYYVRVKVTYPTFTCPADDTVYRTVELEDASLFTYKVYRIPLTAQAAALSNCAADGAHLVRVTSSAKMDVLLQLTRTCPGYSAGVNYWIDLTNSNAVNFSDVNQWVSSVGIPLPSGNNFWDRSQPNTPSIDHCVTLWEVMSYNFCDRHCTNNAYSYICEKDFPVQ